MGKIFAVHSKQSSSDLSKVVKDAMDDMCDNTSWITKTQVKGNIGLGCYESLADSKAKEDGLLFSTQNTGYCIVANARIYYKEELISLLTIDPQTVKEISDIQLILLSYQKWGEDCLKNINGDFAFVIWDESKQKLFCACDHFGSRPLYYLEFSDFFAISSDPIGFLSIPNFHLRLKDNYIFDAICSIAPSNDYSAFTGVNKLEPANYMTIVPGLSFQKTLYWELKVNGAYSSLDENDASKELKNRFIESLKQRSLSSKHIGLELSGGLDSSSIAICLSKTLDENASIFAFTHALSQNAFLGIPPLVDELKYSKQVVKECGICDHVIINEENSIGSFAELISVLKNTYKPVNQTYSLNSDLLYEQVEMAGINILLSGFGGDEGVTNAGIDLKKKNAQRCERTNHVRIAKNKDYKLLVSFYKMCIKHQIRKIKFWILKPFKKDWTSSQFNTFAINSDLAKEHRLKKKYAASFYSSKNLNVRQRQRIRLLNPYVSMRLENSYRQAQVRNIEYRYPFLDVKLLEFYYSLDSELKYKNGFGRYIFRKSMESLLPDEIRLRTDKSATTIPNVMHRIATDEKKYREIIIEGKVNNRYHYVNYEKLEEILALIKSEYNLNRIYLGPRVFLSPLSVLILQKWQREGKIDIGIKC